MCLALEFGTLLKSSLVSIYPLAGHEATTLPSTLLQDSCRSFGDGKTQIWLSKSQINDPLSLISIYQIAPKPSHFQHDKKDLKPRCGSYIAIETVARDLAWALELKRITNHSTGSHHKTVDLLESPPSFLVLTSTPYIPKAPPSPFQHSFTCYLQWVLHFIQDDFHSSRIISCLLCFWFRSAIFGPRLESSSPLILEILPLRRDIFQNETLLWLVYKFPRLPYVTSICSLNKSWLVCRCWSLSWPEFHILYELWTDMVGFVACVGSLIGGSSTELGAVTWLDGSSEVVNIWHVLRFGQTLWASCWQFSIPFG